MMSPDEDRDVEDEDGDMGETEEEELDAAGMHVEGEEGDKESW